jgi:hypothetical protein
MTNPQAGRTFFQRMHAGEKHRRVMGIRYARDPSPPASHSSRFQWLITTGLIKAVLIAAAGAVG